MIEIFSSGVLVLYIFVLKISFQFDCMCLIVASLIYSARRPETIVQDGKQDTKSSWECDDGGHWSDDRYKFLEEMIIKNRVIDEELPSIYMLIFRPKYGHWIYH